ncbi:transmembrane emp24 domain-containing protein 7 isoform X2 [Culicoides brevitarsis]|uniref:transmembrane emp24 domain-containing protein 7 isoform X2 n=1 Tax=Culicoides brevitarsis TaxID=469753 RepID=UPI00307C7523
MKVSKKLNVSAGLAIFFCFYFKTTKNAITAVELTFELPDNAKECFYQEIKKNQSANLEFQVVTGGQYDVDVTLESPKKEILYRQIKTQFDSHSFTAEHSGVYVACFSNEFSTFSHKLVYVDFQVGDERALPGIDDHATALTQMESSAKEIHENLNSILDYQTHHRLREAQGRKFAEDLNERTLWWSLAETVVMIMIAIAQVCILRNFFNEKKPSQMNYGRL